MQDADTAVEKRYNAEDLLALAGEHEYTRISHRLVLDWVEQGLLDAPTKRGLGRARGTSATWPEEQAQLFLALLHHRPRVGHLADLCNVVVWIWLFWGDHYVPLRQVRRALRTWGKVASGAGWQSGKAVARRVIGLWAHPDAGAKARRDAVEALAREMYRRAFNREELVAVLTPVLDPHGTGQARGPAGAPVSAASFAELVWSRAAVLERLDTLDDDLFEWARFAYLTGVQSYLRSQPALSADSEFGHLFPRVDLNLLANDACEAVVTTLGRPFLWQARPADGTLINPETWRENHLRMDVHTVQTAAGLDMGLEVKPRSN